MVVIVETVEEIQTRLAKGSNVSYVQYISRDDAVRVILDANRNGVLVLHDEAHVAIAGDSLLLRRVWTDDLGEEDEYWAMHVVQ
jgi:hypothetical protein